MDSECCDLVKHRNNPRFSKRVLKNVLTRQDKHASALFESHKECGGLLRGGGDLRAAHGLILAHVKF